MNKIDIIKRDYKDPPNAGKEEKEKEPEVMTRLQEIVEWKPSIKKVRIYFSNILEKLGNLESEEFE